MRCVKPHPGLAAMKNAPAPLGPGAEEISGRRCVLTHRMGWSGWRRLRLVAVVAVLWQQLAQI